MDIIMVAFSSAEVSGVGRRRSAAVGLIFCRGKRRIWGGGELHHAARAHRAVRPPEIKIHYGIGVGKLQIR